MTSCFTTASFANRLPTACFLRCLRHRKSQAQDYNCSKDGPYRRNQSSIQSAVWVLELSFKIIMSCRSKPWLLQLRGCCSFTHVPQKVSAVNSVTTVKETHKKQSFIFPKDNYHIILYLWRALIYFTRGDECFCVMIFLLLLSGVSLLIPVFIDSVVCLTTGP